MHWICLNYEKVILKCTLRSIRYHLLWPKRIIWSIYSMVLVGSKLLEFNLEDNKTNRNFITFLSSWMKDENYGHSIIFVWIYYKNCVRSLWIPVLINSLKKRIWKIGRWHRFFASITAAATKKCVASSTHISLLSCFCFHIFHLFEPAFFCSRYTFRLNASNKSS